MSWCFSRGLATSREAYGTMAPGDLPTLELLNKQNELAQTSAALNKQTYA